MNDTKWTHCYVGYKDCGCMIAVRLDTRDKNTGKQVAEMISDGLIVERMSNEEFEAKGGISALFKDCPHEERQLSLL